MSASAAATWPESHARGLGRDPGLVKARDDRSVSRNGLTGALGALPLAPNRPPVARRSDLGTHPWVFGRFEGVFGRLDGDTKSTTPTDGHPRDQWRAGSTFEGTAVGPVSRIPLTKPQSTVGQPGFAPFREGQVRHAYSGWSFDGLDDDGSVSRRG